jgi:hypothetical protein
MVFAVPAFPIMSETESGIAGHTGDAQGADPEGRCQQDTANYPSRVLLELAHGLNLLDVIGLRLPGARS